MTKSFKPLRNKEEADKRLHSKEWLAERKRQAEHVDAEDRLKLVEYLKLKGELE